MGSQRQNGVNSGVATIIAACIAAFTALTLKLIDHLHNPYETDTFVSTDTSKQESSEIDYNNSPIEDSHTIVSSESSLDISEKNILRSYNEEIENGRVEIFDNCKGVAYIYKNHLEEYPIGSIYDGLTTTGWGIDIYAGKNSVLFQVGGIPNSDKFSCSALYFENGENMGWYEGYIAAMSTESGDLKIEFNFDDTYFDFRNTDEVYVVKIAC